MIKTFKTEDPSEEFIERIRSRVKKSQFLNWYQDCIVGRVRKKSFYYYFHKAYIRNSFNKYLYGRVTEKDGVTIIKTIILSPFLSLQLHIKLILFFGILKVFKFDVNTYISDVLSSYLLFGTFSIIIGVISQVIPISDNKRKILYGVVEESFGSEVNKEDIISRNDLDK